MVTFVNDMIAINIDAPKYFSIENISDIDIYYKILGAKDN